MRSLPHGVLLQDEQGELAVLVSAAAKPFVPELSPADEALYGHTVRQMIMRIRPSDENENTSARRASTDAFAP